MSPLLLHFVLYCLDGERYRKPMNLIVKVS